VATGPGEDGRAGGAGEGVRLRHRRADRAPPGGAGRAGRSRAHHGRGHGDGDAGVLLAGAGARRAARRPQRSVRAGRGAVLPARAPAALPGREPAGRLLHADGDPARAAVALRAGLAPRSRRCASRR
jgi:hypothetical protein